MQATTPAAGDPVFSPAVETQHRRIDADAYEDIYVVGDVHGCIRELEELVETVGADGETLFVFVGDLVRKGPDSSAVLGYVREHENMVTVRGNNEQKLLDGRADCDGLTGGDREFIASLPVAVSWDDALVVHGGIDPRVPLVEHSVEDLLTKRLLAPEADHQHPYWFDHHSAPPQVFFGHTVLAEPFESRWAVGLDTGCVYGGQLTAYHYGTGEYVTLDARRTYEFRDPEKFITPEQTAGSREGALAGSNQRT
jgi:serine/threonine protein phosphatase 1